MIRAMWRLRLRGTIDRETYSRYKAMLFAGLPIAGQFGDDAPRRFAVQHLRLAVKKRMIVDRAAQGLVDDLFENLSFDGVVTWILENWQLIVQIMLGLMVFLNAEYEAE